MFILLSHLSFRRHHTASELPVRMPFFPWMQYAGLLLLAAILVTMGLDARPLRLLGVRRAVADPDLGGLLHLEAARTRASSAAAIS